MGLPVFRWISSSRHAVVITPVARWVGSLVGRPIPTVTLLASGDGLPHASARSAHTLDFSRPARRSLTLRPAGSPHRLAARLSRRLRRFRYLHRRSDSYWLERPICQAGFAPTEDPRLFTAHTSCGPVSAPFHGATVHSIGLSSSWIKASRVCRRLNENAWSRTIGYTGYSA